MRQLDLGRPSAGYDLLWPRFWTEVVVRGDRGAARRELERALDQTPLEPLDRPYLGLAGLYATLGDPAELESMLAAFKRAVPDAPAARYEDDESRVEAELAMHEGRFDEAVATRLRRSEVADSEALYYTCRNLVPSRRFSDVSSGGVPPSPEQYLDVGATPMLRRRRHRTAHPR